MSLGPAAKAKMEATTGITDIVAARIFPQYVRESDNVYPLIVYKVENVDPQLSHDGPTGLESADLIIAAIGATQKDARILADAIQLALNGNRGTWDTLYCQGCFLKDDGISDDVVTEPTTEESLYYTKELSFTVWYTK